jgi:hypothetical protein
MNDEASKKIREGLERLILRHRMRTPSERTVRTLLLYRKELFDLDKKFLGEYLLELERIFECFIKEVRNSALRKEVEDFIDSDDFRRRLGRELLRAKEGGWVFKEKVKEDI